MMAPTTPASVCSDSTSIQMTANPLLAQVAAMSNIFSLERKPTFDMKLYFWLLSSSRSLAAFLPGLPKLVGVVGWVE